MSSILVNSISPYSGNSVSFTNNANVAGSFSAVTYLNLPSSTFTGGTVNGLTATTISATTYLNLPSNTFTGGTISDLTATTITVTTLNATSIPSANISDALYTVNYGLNASGTSISTGSICGYGVNVFTGVTYTDYATKLPQPVTGKSVKIINLSNSILSVYPSNTGGTINNLAINKAALIPPDGKLYEFICVENPLPGAWVWSAPATNQYDSGEILVPTITATGSSFSQQQGIVMADANNVGASKPYFGYSTWAYDGKHNPFVTSGASVSVINSIAFKPSTPWLGITKIKVYTNLSDCSISGTTGASEIGLMGGIGVNYYAASATTNGLLVWETGDFINSGPAYAGNITNYWSTDQKITGSPILTGTSVQENIGDPGTYYGEIILNNSITPFVSSAYPIIGDTFIDQILYPNMSPSGLNNTFVDRWNSGYISLQMRPLKNQNWSELAGIKVRFFIEYYS